MAGKDFFAEGDPDLRILRAFAKKIKHEAYNKLDSYSLFFRPYKTNDISDAMNYFQSLQKIIRPSLKGFCLRDYFSEEERRQDLPDNFTVEYWKRKEIENYLIHPVALLRFVEKKGFQGLFSEIAEQYLRAHLPPAVYKNPIQDTIDGNGSDFLEKFFSKIGLHINKGNFSEIAEIMEADEIHPDIKDVLDKLNKFLS